MKEADNQEFITLLDVLKKKGIKETAIAKAIGVRRSKLYDIRRGASTASKDLINKLCQAYPELQPSSVNDERQKEIDSLKEKVIQLQDRVIELQDIKNVLKDIKGLEAERDRVREQLEANHKILEAQERERKRQARKDN